MSGEESRTIAANPWAHLDPPGSEAEWLFNGDSYMKSLRDGDPERLIKNCAYVGIEEKQPVYSIADAEHPAGFQDIAVFTDVEGKDYRISKRIVDQVTKGRLKEGDWVTLKVRGCCNIIGILEE